MSLTPTRPDPDPDPPAPRRPRVFYIAGPGAVAVAYGNWRDGVDDPSEVALTYSGQFYEVCRGRDYEAYVVSTNAEARTVREGRFRIEHRPDNGWLRRGGLGYHLGEIRYALGLMGSAIRFRADAVLINGGWSHWYLFALLRLFGMTLIPTLHVMLWPKLKALSRSKRLFRRGNAWFFRTQPRAIMAVSPEIGRQVTELVGGAYKPIEVFLPAFRPEYFDAVADPPEGRPFRVLYVGRVEGYKGVFDLLAIARRFQAEGRTDIEFDLCGSGGALDELRRQAAEAGLADRFRTHGHCDRFTMTRMFSASHVLIAPTTSDFVEGFNKVIAEGVLSRRPVITSSVCPAIEYVREAAVEVPPDDTAAYGDAILRLADDPELYRRKQQACLECRSRLLDPARTFGAVLDRLLLGVLGGATDSPPPFNRTSSPAPEGQLERTP